MFTPAPRRLLVAVLCLASAALACARSDVPIDVTAQVITTAIVVPPTSTEPPLSLPSPTSLLAEAGGATATLPAATDTPPSATPALAFDLIPVPNGTLDTDLSGWNITPNWVQWQDGYARVNAGQAGSGALLVQITIVPRGREVRLHFSARSEDAPGGECTVESHQDRLHALPADGEWHAFEVDFSLDAGTQTAVSLQARNNNHCDWLHFDDVYWLVAGGVAGNPATATPAGPTPAQSQTPGAEVETSATAPAATPTLAAIPAGAMFTRAFSVSASGDSPIGAPSDLADGQAITWASLRNGTGAWVFDLASTQSVAGLRLTAHRDGNEDTTLRGIDVSTDGAVWTEVYAARGDCAGTAGCEVVAQATPVEFAFGPIDAQYVRVRSGPTRFALAEVELAVIGN